MQFNVNVEQCIIRTKLYTNCIFVGIGRDKIVKELEE